MKKKALIIANVVKTHIMVFHLPYLKWLSLQGYEVHVCAKNDYVDEIMPDIPYCDKFHDISFDRQPVSFKNIKAYHDLKEIMESNSYDIIHCHTPIGGALGRLASKKLRKNGATIIYTAHGFHFYKGASIKNWLLYFLSEKYLASHTDYLITINQEDYKNAVKYNFQSKNIVLINGVGIDLTQFQPQNNEIKYELRRQYEISDKAFILFFAAELRDVKNQELLIETAKILKPDIPNLLILLAGDGDKRAHYQHLIEKYELHNNVKLLGFRKDIKNLMSLSDVGVSSSKREGLPLNVMEAMATGLPLVVTDCRGNRDLVKHSLNGYVVNREKTDEFAKHILDLYHSKKLRNQFSIESIKEIRKYSITTTLKKVAEIYGNA